jgi:hypothetical protein
LVAASQTDPVGVEHEHDVLPKAELVEPVPHLTQPGCPVEEK